MHICPDLKFHRFEVAVFLNTGFGCGHPIGCNRTVANMSRGLDMMNDTINNLTDHRDGLLINLRRVDVLAEFAITSIEEDEVDATAELLSDLRDVVHRAVA